MQNALGATSISIAPPVTLSLVSHFALSAAIAVLGMFGIYLCTGIGQDPLQSIHTSQEYMAILTRDPSMLRLTIGLDNLFIVLYSSMFLSMGISLWSRSATRALLVASIGLMGLAGLLDLMENMHFMTMISSAAQGFEIAATQIELQVWESLLKFHVSYLGLFLLGFALPTDTSLERVLAFSLRWVQLPVGLLIYLTPAAISLPLVMVRFSFFLFALIAISVAFRPRKSDSNERP